MLYGQNQATDVSRSAARALYIHWPFCRKKCPYCDFNSHVREGIDHQAWAEGLLRALRYWHARLPRAPISSIFFGGGTPSLMEPRSVAALIEAAQALFGLTKNCEITLEANPTSVEASKFEALRAAGVNRVSLGVQSLRDDALKFLGREHSATEALNAVEIAARTFERYSFDLIYALPGQTPEAWAEELREALRYARGHLSLYQLTIEENTAFHHAYHQQHAFQLPGDAQAVALYQHTQRVMEEAGLPAYEISNHASPGQECQHNLTYWRGGEYIGIGPGAHGRVALAEDSRFATRAIKSPERWLAQTQEQGEGLEEMLELTQQERAEEAVLMGLRLAEGITLAALPTDSANYLKTLFSDGRVARLVAHELLVDDATRLRATPAGQLVLNRVIGELLK